MVLAVAALVVQMYAVPAPFAATRIASPATEGSAATVTSAEDGTKPDTTKPSGSKGAAASHAAPAASSKPGTDMKDSNAADAARTHLNLENVALVNGASKGPDSAALTALSLTDPQKQGLSTVRIPEPGSTRPIPISAVNTTPSKRQWLVLTVFEHSAATFDAYTTRQAIGRGAVEEDPMMRPFAHSPAMYAAIQAGPVLLDLLARRMQRSENPMFRRMWWMPQTIASAGFLTSGVHNTGVHGSR